MIEHPETKQKCHYSAALRRTGSRPYWIENQKTISLTVHLFELTLGFSSKLAFFWDNVIRRHGTKKVIQIFAISLTVFALCLVEKRAFLRYLWHPLAATRTVLARFCHSDKRALMAQTDRAQNMHDGNYYSAPYLYFENCTFWGSFLNRVSSIVLVTLNKKLYYGHVISCEMWAWCVSQCGRDHIFMAI